MNLKSLLLSCDDKTVRVLRRVLGDLEIEVEHSSATDDVIRRITRNRYEAIIVDCTDPKEAGNVFRAAKAAPVNKRALSVVLVETTIGLKGGFDMGAHFVLHKPLAVERAKSSFRAVRALMKSERRLQMRVPVEIPVECIGSGRYPARTVDVSEGGLAVQFPGRKAKERTLRFSFSLPGTAQKLELWGEAAWEGSDEHVGYRFQNIPDNQHKILRGWLHRQLYNGEPEEPPIVCRLTELSVGGCYLTTTAPFPKSTRVLLSVPDGAPEIRANGIVRLVHPEYGMGVEFLQPAPEDQAKIRKMIEALHAGTSPEVHVDPNGLETDPEQTPAPKPAVEDALVKLFRKQTQLPVEAFLEQMQQQRQLQESH